MPFMNYWTTVIYSLFLGLFFCLSFQWSLLSCHGLCLSFAQAFCPSTLESVVTFPIECWLLIFSVFSFPFQVWWHALVSPHSITDSCLSLALCSISHYYKNYLDGYDDSDLCFCLKVMVLSKSDSITSSIIFSTAYISMWHITWYWTLFYYQLMHTTLKKAELLKHSKLDKNAPTCFGLHRNHLQGAKVSAWLKITRLVNSICVKDVQGVVSAMAAYWYL